MSSPVEILLSTYNGEKYLTIQLESILKQDYSNWKLIIRDDGSKDGTLSIIREYAEKHPGKILLIKDEEGNMGYSASFSKLLRHSSADYIMYCDQDDYWYPEKISTMMAAMIVEEITLPVKAHLLFSDVQMVDSEMKVTEQSFLRRTNYSAKKGMQIFFLKNYVPGCNMLFNRRLIEQALHTENSIKLHDHWLLLVCSSVGKISCINKPLMQYRMHDNNAIGFTEANTSLWQKVSLFFKNNLKYGFSNKKYREVLYSANIRQMQNICECLAADVSKDAITFSKIDQSNYFRRKIRNITRPYICENSLLKQLTYINCF